MNSNTTLYYEKGMKRQESQMYCEFTALSFINWQVIRKEIEAKEPKDLEEFDSFLKELTFIMNNGDALIDETKVKFIVKKAWSYTFRY